MSGELVLITGVSGFIGKHLAREFLAAGYRVRGTVRSSAKAEAVRATLARRGDVGGLEFAVVDLTSDDGWPEAAAGVDHVVHSASPFPMVQPKKPAELVRPAVDGTLRALKAAVSAGARSFVQTSSVAAITPGNGGCDAPCTEDDWAVLGSESATPYVLSKTLAERTARDFIAKEAPAIRFMSVNPGFVMGPVLDREGGTSAQLVEMLMRGKYPAVPRIQFPVVDVRDVAAIHRLAIERGQANGRYIAADGSLWMREMAAILRKRLGDRVKRVPSRELPDFVVRLVGLFDPSVRTIAPDLGIPVKIDASTTRRQLGTSFISSEEALVAMASSLLEFPSR